MGLEDIKSELMRCEICSQDFELIPIELKFYREHELPKPNCCPGCRQRRRLSMRNERKLYRRTCDRCKLDLVSTYPSDSPYTVYCQECFWKWQESF